MSLMARQNRMLVAEEWKQIYQSFKNAEFKSYDFDSLRRVMISYIRENYPEDFNDYIDSSEYMALIDLIAFLGQNLAFRIDLNSRENFLELAERRESILRLARMISYNPKRNQCANGLLKLETVSTTERIISSNNRNLQDQTIIWNDYADSNWYENFISILNAALPNTNQVGNPSISMHVNGLLTSQYNIYQTNPNQIINSFRSTVKGSTFNFEIVPCLINNNFIIEKNPLPGNEFTLLYREDGHGPGSNHTGFFCHFKQGTLHSEKININIPSANKVVNVVDSNINNTDVWLYHLGDNGQEITLWDKIDAISGNAIYNQTENVTRNIYSVTSGVNDTINIIFSDGVFGNIPHGGYKIYYRTSANKTLSIHPGSIRNVTVSLPYKSKSNNRETLTLSFSLKTTVNNGTISETNESIKKNAPGAYYTQNRLITGEDYQVGINSINQSIVKSKTINRAASGFSRYFDLLDPTGKYSNTVLFGDDGVIYKENQMSSQSFAFNNINEIQSIIRSVIEPAIKNPELNSFYLDNFPRVEMHGFSITWDKDTYIKNLASGKLVGVDGNPIRLGMHSSTNLKYLRINSLVKFIPPPNHVFVDGIITTAQRNHSGSKKYIWAKIVRVDDSIPEQTTIQSNIFLNQDIPTGAILSEIVTPLPTVLSEQLYDEIFNQIASYKTFGLRYSRDTFEWNVILQENINTMDGFSLTNQGDNSNTHADSSWMILFRSIGKNYNLHTRTLRYVFESDQEIQFYYNSKERKPTTPVDIISILKSNTNWDTDDFINVDIDWRIIKEYKDRAGYINSKKVIISFTDTDKDSVIDNPDAFNTIMNTNNIDNFVFLKAVEINQKINDYEYIEKDNTDVIILDNRWQIGDLAPYKHGQIFYFKDEYVFEKLDKRRLTFTKDDTYRSLFGRGNIHFKYIHYSDFDSRIDPSVSNILDTYILSDSYDKEFRKWLRGGVSDKPIPPNSDQLHVAYSSHISKIKSISDEIIYHPVKYTVLFGNKAENQFKAKFKVIKNKNLIINDNELKADIISGIDSYFSLEKWNFGDTFYFSDLSAYIQNRLSPKITTFLIIPVNQDMQFGDLYEIHAASDELFINDVSVSDIEIIDEITPTTIRTDK